jgi:hypothetical protein
MDRVSRRNISDDQLDFWPTGSMSNPKCRKENSSRDFFGMTVCGEGELVKTFLQPGQIATGEELK